METPRPVARKKSARPWQIYFIIAMLGLIIIPLISFSYQHKDPPQHGRGELLRRDIEKNTRNAATFYCFVATSLWMILFVTMGFLRRKRYQSSPKYWMIAVGILAMISLSFQAYYLFLAFLSAMSPGGG